MSFSSFLADRAAVRDRGEWFIELYLKDPNNAEEIVRLSRRGTAIGAQDVTIGDDVLPKHTPYRKRVVKAPTMTQSLWQQGAILSNSLPSFGAASLNNRDGGLDKYRPARGYRWAGQRCKVFFADAADVQNTIGKVFDGQLGDPQFSLSAPVTVPLRGREALFAPRISERVYRGTSYMLELSGDRTVDFGNPPPVDLKSDMTIIGWWWFEVAPSGEPIVWGWQSAGSIGPWRLKMKSDRTLRFRGDVGGTGEGPTTSTALTLKRFYHVAVVVLSGDVTFYVWDDDLQSLATEVFPGAFSGVRDAAAAHVNYGVSSTDGLLWMWADELRVWNRAMTLAEIEADRHRPIPDAAIPADLVHYARMDDGVGTAVTDSSATAAHGTISGAGTSLWLWAMEGGPELAGTPKPHVSGENFGTRCILVDPIRSCYQVAAGGRVKSIQSYEGGLGHTMDANAASFRAFILNAPATTGHVIPYRERGLWRPKDAPVLPVSALVEGYDDGPLGYASTADGIVRDTVTRRGPKLADPAGLDTTSFAALNAAAPAVMGFADYEGRPIREWLDFTMRGVAGWWGYVRASVLFHVEQFTGPGAVAVRTLDQRRIVSLDEAPPQAVVYQVVVRYGRNDVVLQEDQVAAAVKGTLGWQRWTKEWREKPATDAALREAYPGEASRSITVETGLQRDEDAQALADFLLALLRGPKEGWVVAVDATGLESKIGETESLVMVLQQDRERLGLDGTKRYAVVTVEDTRQEGRVRQELWG